MVDEHMKNNDAQLPVDADLSSDFSSIFSAGG